MNLNTTDADLKAFLDEFGFQPSFAITTNNYTQNASSLYKSYAEEGIIILSHSQHPSQDETMHQLW